MVVKQRLLKYLVFALQCFHQYFQVSAGFDTFVRLVNIGGCVGTCFEFDIIDVYLLFLFSDIVAMFYKELDILGPNVVTANVLPQDFISDSDHEIQSDIFHLPATQILNE